MLHYLDVMIGFAFTMLVLSLTITAIVQAIPVYLRNLKGADLQQGLADLLTRIAPDLKGHALTVADSILRDPLLSPPRYFGASRKRTRANVIQREEFVRLLLDFSTGQGAADNDTVKAARAAVLKMLQDAKIPDPTAMLTQVRDRIAELERDEPHLSAGQRGSKAMLELFLAGPGKDFMAKLTGWYDQTIDRVEAAYTAHLRGWTVAFSALLVLVLHLDSFDLLSRLNTDPALRQQAVAAAIAYEGTNDGTAPVDPARAIACQKQHLAAEPTPQAMAAYVGCMGLDDAVKLDLVRWPESVETWVAGFGANPGQRAFHLIGMLLSVGLLTLGAPFWYALLKDMIKMRSTIAKKDEDARSERQSAQPAP
jgi:hypothetical protein